MAPVSGVAVHNFAGRLAVPLSRGRCATPAASRPRRVFQRVVVASVTAGPGSGAPPQEAKAPVAAVSPTPAAAQTAPAAPGSVAPVPSAVETEVALYLDFLPTRLNGSERCLHHAHVSPDAHVTRRKGSSTRTRRARSSRRCRLRRNSLL